MMNKEALTRVPINPAARNRWSPRAFLDRPVEPEKLIAMLEAARWSASGGNVQPWRFLVGQHPDATWQKIFSALDAGNQEWNRHTPLLMVAVGAKISPFDGAVSPVFQYDTGQAVSSLVLEAMHQGIHTHQMGGFSVERIHELFAIPGDHLAIAVIAAGYIGSPESLSQRLQQRELQPRTRKALEEIVFGDQFGNPAPFLNPRNEP